MVNVGAGTWANAEEPSATRTRKTESARTSDFLIANLSVDVLTRGFPNGPMSPSRRDERAGRNLLPGAVGCVKGSSGSCGSEITARSGATSTNKSLGRHLLYLNKH